MTLAALALCASAARAATIQADNVPPGPFQAMVDQMHVASYPGVVRLTLDGGPCGGAWGCTFFDSDGVPHIFLLPTDYLHERQLLYHELGHVFDLSVPNDALRATFQAIWNWNQPVANWWTPSPTRGGPPGEWFAEGYRMCADGIKTEAQAAHFNGIYAASGYQYPGADAGGYHILANGWAPESAARARWALRQQLAVCRLIG